MNDLLHNLIEALREELKQYGEMLAVLDQQQHSVVQRQVNDLLQNVAAINSHAEAITAVRREREQHQRNVARFLGLDEAAAFTAIVPLLPADYRPLVLALVSENNELLERIHHRTRQNHLLLSHAVELMQQLITAIFPGGGPRTYNQTGRLPVNPMPQHSLYESVG